MFSFSLSYICPDSSIDKKTKIWKGEKGMGKRTTPLLYIYQRKEAEVEALNQEFVYKKFKVQVKKKEIVEKEKLDLEEFVVEKRVFTNNMSIQERVESIQSMSEENQMIKLGVEKQMYVGAIKEINSEKVVIQISDEEVIELKIEEITSVEIG
jgi:hypothetical protein